MRFSFLEALLTFVVVLMTVFVSGRVEPDDVLSSGDPDHPLMSVVQRGLATVVPAPNPAPRPDRAAPDAATSRGIAAQAPPGPETSADLWLDQVDALNGMFSAASSRSATTASPGPVSSVAPVDPVPSRPVTRVEPIIPSQAVFGGNAGTSTADAAFRELLGRTERPIVDDATRTGRLAAQRGSILSWIDGDAGARQVGDGS